MKISVKIRVLVGLMQVEAKEMLNILFNKHLFLSLARQGNRYTFVSSSDVNDLRMKQLMKKNKLTAKLAGLLQGMVMGLLLMSVSQVSGQGFEYYYGGDSEDQGSDILQTDDRPGCLCGPD